MADGVQKGLVQWEKFVSSEKIGAAKLPGFSLSKSEASSFRFIHTSFKALHPNGSEKAGVSSSFESFLDDSNSHFLFEDFRSNRSYVVFPNGAYLWFQRNSISTFLAQLPNPNRLLLSVSADCSSDLVLVGCRTLGLLDFFVVRPLWILLRDDSVTLSDMSRHYESLVSWTKRVASGEFQSFREVIMPFPDLLRHILKDSVAKKVFDELYEDSFDDRLLFSCFLTVTSSLISLLERQLKDHLPKGILREKDVDDKIINVPKVNIVVYCVF